jgi:Kef-type K+ transport system membrane component KefB
MPATHYAKASYLMGAFLAGLTFCSSDGLHHIFVRQFKRLLQWLMRIFFAASIGFQVPVKDFSDSTVIWQGLVFTFALVGKIVGTIGFGPLFDFVPCLPFLQQRCSSLPLLLENSQSWIHGPQLQFSSALYRKSSSRLFDYRL